MITDLQRARLQWILNAKPGSVLPNDLFEIKNGRGWGEPIRDAVAALVKENEELKYKVDKYGLALVMIRAGTENPQKVASNALALR